jgi:hypothetical protein
LLVTRPFGPFNEDSVRTMCGVSHDTMTEHGKKMSDKQCTLACAQDGSEARVHHRRQGAQDREIRTSKACNSSLATA